MILLIEKIKNKLLLEYRKAVFRSSTNQDADGLKIFGTIFLINKNILCGRNLILYPNVMFFGDGEIVIGNNVSIGNDTLIYSTKNGGGISIGDNTQIAGQSYIIDMDHGIKKGIKIKDQPNNSAPISIGNDVWIGANCTVLKGSIIEDGAVIGAKSLVNSKIIKESISLGIPAKFLKERI